ncbi:MAG: hypothetical protein JJU41_11100 [Bacteroidetes bacterium]|nr:hypothetical protein [Bacteroidota bacterium]
MKNISFYIITLLLLFMSQQAVLFAQTNEFGSEDILVLHDSLKTDDGSFEFSDLSNWKFQPRDDLTWADPGFDDSGWHNIQHGLSIKKLPDTLWNGYGWWRLTFQADSTFYNKNWVLGLLSMGAFEVYLDGERIHHIGQFSTNAAEEKIRNSQDMFFPSVIIHPSDTHVIAVRHSNHNAELMHRFLGQATERYTSISLGFAPPELNEIRTYNQKIRARTSGLSLGVLFLLLLLYLFLYYRFARDKVNLYIILLLTLLMLHAAFSFGSTWFEINGILVYYGFFVLLFQIISLLPVILSELFGMLKYRFWKYFAISGIPVGLVASYTFTWITYVHMIVGAISLISCIYLLIKAKKENISGVVYVAGGFIVSVLSMTAVLFLSGVFSLITSETAMWLITLIYTAIPIGLTLYIADNYSNLVEGLEQQVFERTADLKKSLDDLHATQSQLVQQEKLASLGQLTAGIAHEIKNPLNFVNNFSDVSLEMIDEAIEELQKIGENEHAAETAAILADIKANLEKIHHHGSRADSIVKSMLMHSRGGDGKPEPTPLNPFIKEYVNLAFHGMRASKEPINVDIDLQLDDRVGEVPLIAEDFSRVLLNLCNNAFDAMRSKLNEGAKPETGGDVAEDVGRGTTASYLPKLTIRTKSENGQILIEIEDNGPGIPAEIKDKILQPFFTTKKGTQGTGLGLSITNDIIKAHGGIISIKTIEHEGTTFTIELHV